MIGGNFIRTGVSCLETERSYTAIDATARVGLKSQTTGVRFGRTGANYATTDGIIVPGGIGNINAVYDLNDVDCLARAKMTLRNRPVDVCSIDCMPWPRN